MSLPIQITAFKSGVSTKLALSSAFSPIFNPRGLEANFTPAWISTFNDATAFSDRFSVETEPYLSIPGKYLQKLKIDAETEQLLELRRELDDQSEQDEEFDELQQYSESDGTPATIRRKSQRLQETKANAKQDRGKLRENVDAKLAARSVHTSHTRKGKSDRNESDKDESVQDESVQDSDRDESDEEESDEEESDEDKSDEEEADEEESDEEESDEEESEEDHDTEFSFEAPSVPDRQSRDSRPDLCIAHTVGGSIDEPTIDYVHDTFDNIDHSDSKELEQKLLKLKSQRELRAGIKVVHKCAVLIAEFKSLYQSRSGIELLGTTGENVLDDIDMGGRSQSEPTGERQWHPSRSGMIQAIEQLMPYVSAYFLNHPHSSETIALASSGPFWQWQLINRSEAVKYDWLSLKPIKDDENIGLVMSFSKRFGGGEVYLLATPASDAQIGLMTHEMARIAAECDKTFTDKLPTALNFELLPDCPRQ